MEPSSLFSQVSILRADSITLIIVLLVLVVLLVCSALISGSEVAYFSLSPSDKEELEDSKTKNSNRVITLLSKPKELLATILIANNFVNIAIVILSTFVVDSLFENSSLSAFWQTIIQVGVVTFVILLIGEVIPKVYATKNGIKLSKFMAIPLQGLKAFFKPLSYFLISVTSVIDKRVKKKGTDISVDHLEQALELTSDEGIEDQEAKMLKGIVKFGNTDVKQIMKPRLDVTAFSEDTEYFELLKEIEKCGFSRIPVYTESLDKVKGVLYIKDLLPYLQEKNDFEWNTLLRIPFFVPENKKIDDLLKEFQESKIHLAVVVDEYGGTSGVVTLEDIIEEIVGEITDEFDDDDIVYSKLDDSNYVFEGKTPLVDVYKILEIDGDVFESNKGESDTLGGFLMEISGKILKRHEKISFENYNFNIEAADKRRIKQIKITINEIQEDEE